MRLNHYLFFYFLDPSGGEESQRKVRTLYACVGEHESELNFEPNQVITDGKFLKKNELIYFFLPKKICLSLKVYIFLSDPQTLVQNHSLGIYLQ